MATRETIDDFLAQRTLAVAGVSRKPLKFGSVAYKELKRKGYRVLAVNPNAAEIQGDPCYADLASLPEPVGGVFLSLPPAQAERVVRDALAAGIRRVWMQPGSESEAAVQFCQENGISAVTGQCILMHAEPVTSIHRFHRWLWRALRRSPR